MNHQFSVTRTSCTLDRQGHDYETQSKISDNADMASRAKYRVIYGFSNCFNFPWRNISVLLVMFKYSYALFAQIAWNELILRKSCLSVRFLHPWKYLMNFDGEEFWKNYTLDVAQIDSMSFVDGKGNWSCYKTLLCDLKRGPHYDTRIFYLNPFLYVLQIAILFSISIKESFLRCGSVQFSS
jgi:hypothetical protein